MHRHCRMSGAGARISLLQYLLHCFPTELTHTTDSMASMLKPNSKRPPPVVRKSMVQGALDNSKTPLYGMDKELAERQAAKFDVTLQHQCQSWLEELTGSPLPDPDDFMGSLKDGSILCKAMNVIQPKSIKKIQTSKMPFKQMENVSAFIKACRTYGIPEYQLFTTVDLFEAKDPNSVVQTIQALGGVAKKKGFAGPTIGVAQTSGGEKRSSLHLSKKAKGSIKENDNLGKIVANLAKGKVISTKENALSATFSVDLTEVMSSIQEAITEALKKRFKNEDD